jgi:DNA polymerase-3 subunit gamma/tau
MGDNKIRLPLSQFSTSFHIKATLDRSREVPGIERLISISYLLSHNLDITVPMPYQVMARERRPEVFDEVVSQGHIINTLQNAIRADRVAQAYLFSGPRGTGKTTTARLLAKALNCEQGPTPTPCGTCKSCMAIKDGRSLDVREIDGASTNSVEDVRQLREEVGYAASKGKRKVYIIDEVHMLSISAFNALLKTLEEPPPHVIFVFATTELNKVPDTILSRCQRYNFRRIPTIEIVEELKKIVSQRNLEAEEEALFLLGRKAGGAMRDALSLMDQVISFSDAGIRAEDVRTLLGIVPRDLFFGLTDAIASDDGATGLKIVNSLIEEGGDIGEFVEGMVEHFRHLLVARVEGNVIGADLSESDLTRYREAAQSFEEQDLLRMLNTVADLELNIGRVGDPRFWLELTIMKLIKAASTADLQTVIDQLGRAPASGPRPSLPRTVERAGSVQSPAPKRIKRPAAPAATPVKSPPEDPPTSGATEDSEPSDDEPAPVASVDLSMVCNRWEDVVQRVKDQKVSVGTFLSEGTPQSLDDNQLVVMFKRHRDFHANQVRRNKDAVESCIKEILKVEIRIVCEVDYDDLPQEIVHEQKVEDDERVQMALRIFNGEIMKK